jgi:hypothetical protein
MDGVNRSDGARARRGAAPRRDPKDYAHLVDFPVEIVGRDGAVRRYSFEESVRLYQRRISSASIRYSEGPMVAAEQAHCRRRIEQLRRSYFARYGWAAMRVVDSPGMLAGDFAGEVAAFLRRVHETADTPTDRLEFAFLEEGEHHQAYSVRPAPHPAPGSPVGAPAQSWLLYLYRFHDAGPCPGRDAFFYLLKVLRGAQLGPDVVERLIAFHHTADCGLIFTSGGPASGGASASADVAWLSLGDPDDDALRAGMLALRRGQEEAALGCFAQAYEAQHFRRSAYVAAAVVADRLGAFEQGRTAALMGARYFPRDPALRYANALLALRLGDSAAAAKDLAELHRLLPGGIPPLVLDGACAAVDGRPWTAARAFAHAERALAGSDPDLLSAVQQLRGPLRAWLGASLLGIGLVVAGAAAATLQLGTGLALLLPGLALLPAARVALRRTTRRKLRQPASRGLRLSNPAALRSAQP